jgi:hypothetical protein
MRAFLLLVPLLFSTATLAAQSAPAAAPDPDAPVARHVTHLLNLARTRFASIRGAPAAEQRAFAADTSLASSYVMRFGGQDAESDLRVVERRNIHHHTILPVAGGREGIDSVQARVAREVAAVIPAGWERLNDDSSQRSVSWMECMEGGRQVLVTRSLSFETPGVVLVVYKFDRPCPTRTNRSRPRG